MTISLRGSVSCLLPVFLLVALPAATAQSGVGFALTGLARGQSVVLNAVNLGTGAYTQSSSCTVTFQLLDTQGKVVSQTTVNLQPGQASSLEVNRDSLPGGLRRIQVRGVLLYGYSGGANPPAGILQQNDCNIVPSLEVYDDATGKTSFILTGATPLPPPAAPGQ
jgi:hypothetical protein